MGWIKDRIDAEYRKHKRLDWSLIAEKKIISNQKLIIEELIDHYEPYRPITDSEKMKGARESLCKLRELLLK